jgi:pimeloyl-ACP methyl ester carboxylesterase
MAYYRAFPETMKQDELRAKRKLSMPVLVLGGDHGVRDLPLTMLRPVAQQVRGRVLPGCGHFAPEECPEALLIDLLPFLQEGRP